MRHVNTKTISLLFIICFSISCSSFTTPRDKEIALRWNNKDKPPAVVILPFTNTTDEKDINVTFRRIFANQLSSKNYRDLKLNEVDEALSILELTYGKKWKALTPVSLGKLFHCDFLIYGEINNFRRIFLGLYAQMAIDVHLKLVGTFRGKTIWEREMVKRSHEGGIPFSPFGLIPDFLRCGLHMTEGKKVELIEKACRELIEEFPNPPKPAVSVFIIEIQVASFAEKSRALIIKKELKARGYETRLEKVIIANKEWYRVIMGPYYDKKEAEKIKTVIGNDPRFQPIFIHY